MSYISELAFAAKAAAKQLARLSTSQKNEVLLAMADHINSERANIIESNTKDVNNAKIAGLDDAMIDRLILTQERIDDLIHGIKEIVELDDPVGKITQSQIRPNGMRVEKMRIPLGVIGMIYESRPNVTADAGALCFKSGNAIILRGGKEALQSSLAIAQAMQKALTQHNLPSELISVVANADRQHINELLQQTESIDLIIPRGGESLIRFVTDNSKIPVIQHFKGVCHLYVERHADFNKALKLLENGKTQRTGVCNALECLLVDKSIADDFLPQVNALLSKHQVKIHACKSALPLLDNAIAIDENNFGQEYLALEIAVRVVDGIESALTHIDQFGSHHTEVICTEDDDIAALFQRTVDASVVMHNTSSRFSDGSQLGLGAEIGIATTKLHAYGPMGLESLTCEKFIVSGDGQVRE